MTVQDEVKRAKENLDRFDTRKESPVVICQPEIHVNFRAEDFTWQWIDYVMGLSMVMGFILTGFALGMVR